MDNGICGSSPASRRWSVVQCGCMSPHQALEVPWKKFLRPPWGLLHLREAAQSLCRPQTASWIRVIAPTHGCNYPRFSASTGIRLGSVLNHLDLGGGLRPSETVCGLTKSQKYPGRPQKFLPGVFCGLEMLHTALFDRRPPPRRNRKTLPVAFGRQRVAS